MIIDNHNKFFKLYIVIFFYWILLVFSAYMWQTVNMNNIEIPYLPKYVWIIPGYLWINMQWLFVILFILVPILHVYLIKSKYNSLYFRINICLIIILSIFNVISFFWGSMVITTLL